MIKINIIAILSVLVLSYAGINASYADVGVSWKISGLDADGMVLTQVGNHVHGTYNTHQGQGTMDGLLNAKNVWVGSWNEPFNADGGCFSATFSNDSAHLVGSWIYGNPDCEVSPDYEGNWPYNYYCPCLYHSGGDGYFQGEKIVTGKATINT